MGSWVKDLGCMYWTSRLNVRVCAGIHILVRVVSTLGMFPAPSAGKLRFPPCFWPSPGFSLSAHGPKQAKIPLNHRFRPVGVRPEKKMRKIIPDSVVPFFFDFSAPSSLRTRKGPVGLVAACVLLLVACCLLLARRASSTLVP